LFKDQETNQLVTENAPSGAKSLDFFEKFFLFVITLGKDNKVTRLRNISLYTSNQKAIFLSDIRENFKKVF